MRSFCAFSFDIRSAPFEVTVCTGIRTISYSFLSHRPDIDQTGEFRDVGPSNCPVHRRLADAAKRGQFLDLFSVGRRVCDVPPRLARRPTSEAKELAGRAFMPPSHGVPFRLGAANEFSARVGWPLQAAQRCISSLFCECFNAAQSR